MEKIINYSVPLPISETWQKTQEFWQEEKIMTTIKQVVRMPANESLIMEIDEIPNFLSSFQHYMMEFTPIDESTTDVHVKVRINYPGIGLQWIRPDTILKDWARIVGTTCQDIAKNAIAIGAVFYTVIFSVLLVVFTVVFPFRIIFDTVVVMVLIIVPIFIISIMYARHSGLPRTT